MISYIAMVMGLAGAGAVVSRSPGVRLVGFACWLVGNGLWVAWGLAAANWALVAQFGAFEALAAMGAINCAREIRDEAK